MTPSSKGKKVVTLLSGGIDSAVAAWLLKIEGWHVHGLFLDMLGDLAAGQSLEAAKRIAGALGIDFSVKEARKEFKEQIIKYFIDEYLEGMTPNPCVVCNPSIKIRFGLEMCEKISASHLATGHYARVLPEGHGKYGLYAALHPQKDQSYFLHQIPRQWLPRILFPLGELEKRDVVSIGAEAGLSHLAVKESQEICFIKGDYRTFLLSQSVPLPASGPIVDQEGRILGTHKGLYSYTIGQRRGLGIPGPTPFYVTGMDFEKNILIVGKEEDLYSSTLTVRRLNLLVGMDELFDGKCLVKIRSRHQGASAVLHRLDDKKIRVIFDEPQKAVTPGQFAVFYRESKVLGGGQICA